MKYLIFAALVIAGCQQRHTPGGASPADRSLAPSPAEDDPSCISHTCSHNIPFDLDEPLINELQNDLRNLPISSDDQRNVYLAAEFGAFITKNLTRANFSDQKTSTALIWLYQQLVDETGTVRPVGARSILDQIQNL